IVGSYFVQIHYKGQESLIFSILVADTRTHPMTKVIREMSTQAYVLCILSLGMGMIPLEKDAPPLRLVFWETTQACNLSCKHCRASAVTWRDPNELSFEQACRMMDDWPRLGMPILVFSGGEPL